MINLASADGRKLLPNIRLRSAGLCNSTLISFCLGLLALAGNPTTAAEPKRLSDQEYVDRRITWREPRERLLALSLEKFRWKPYVLTIATRSSDLGLNITVGDANGPIHTWVGGLETPILLCNDRIYYADYGQAGPGGYVVAIDLKSRKVLWRSEIEALGPRNRKHLAYDNRIELDFGLGGRNLVYVFGDETDGKYVEAKRMDTGETVAHKIIPPDEGGDATRGPSRPSSNQQ